MRLRTLLAATASGALTIGLVGAVGGPAHAVTAPPPAGAGTIITWGDEDNLNGADAIPVPPDLTAPVTSIAANMYSTGVTTLDGGVRVWGKSDKAEVAFAPTDVTDATAITLTSNNAAVLHADGRVTAWGESAQISEVPTDLRAKAIALQSPNTGFAVRLDGTLATWGTPYPNMPTTGLTDLVDISASAHILALRADGTVVIGGPVFGNLLTVPDSGGKKVVKIATGPLYSGVIYDDGTIAIWGPGYSSAASQPEFLGDTPAGKVVDLSLGASGNVVAVTADGVVHHWGSNADIHTIPPSLTGQPVSSVTIGTTHAAAVITAFRDVTKPTIAGQAKVGQTLTATPATFSLTPDAPATGQWYAGTDPIAGKTGTTLALDSTLVGKSISYRSTATRDDETVVSESVAVGPVTPSTVASTTTLSVSPASGAVGTARTVTATVAKTGGTATGSVTFTVGGTTATQPLTDGKATWTLPALAVGTHSVTAKYNGDGTTEASTSAAASVTVTKASAKVSAKARASGKSKKTAKKVTITVNVKTAQGVSPAGKVSVTLKGKTKKTVTTKVNAQGKVTVTIKKVKRGKYQATVKYAGNSSVSAATGKAAFKV